MATKPITLSAAVQKALRRHTRSGRRRIAQRARVVLLASGPLTQAEIARQVGVSRQTVSTCLRWFRKSGVKGILRKDAPRSGRPKRIPLAVENQISRIAAAAAGLEVPISTSRRLASVYGISHTSVGRICRKPKALPLSEEFDLRRDDKSLRLLRDIYAIYIRPPDFCVVFVAAKPGDGPNGSPESIGQGGKLPKSPHWTSDFVFFMREVASQVPPSACSRAAVLDFKRFLRCVSVESRKEVRKEGDLWPVVGDHSYPFQPEFKRVELHVVVSGTSTFRNKAVLQMASRYAGIRLRKMPRRANCFAELVRLFRDIRRIQCPQFMFARARYFLANFWPSPGKNPRGFCSFIFPRPMS